MIILGLIKELKEVYRTTIGKHGSNLPRTIDYINKNNINENKKAMGGLSRDKDYGSKKKPLS